MARVHQKTAAKDYPAQGIKKGDTYYTWKTRATYGKSYVGTVHRSLTRPVSTSSSAFLNALENIQAAFSGVEDVEGLRAIGEQIRDLGGEEQEKFDNMPDGLQQGDTGQLLEERAQNCETWADAIDEAADAFDTEAEALDAKYDPANVSAWEAYNEFLESGPTEGEEDPEEPNGDDPTDGDEDQERADLLTEKVEEAEGASPF